jgi:hypothetical protein
MTDNGGERTAPRIVRTHDLVSGEILAIVFFPLTDVLTINGHSVTQSPGHKGWKGWAGMSVFHRGLGNKKFVVATDSISKLYT